MSFNPLGRIPPGSPNDSPIFSGLGAQGSLDLPPLPSAALVSLHGAGASSIQPAVAAVSVSVSAAIPASASIPAHGADDDVDMSPIVRKARRALFGNGSHSSPTESPDAFTQHLGPNSGSASGLSHDFSDDEDAGSGIGSLSDLTFTSPPKKRNGLANKWFSNSPGSSTESSPQRSGPSSPLATLPPPPIKRQTSGADSFSMLPPPPRSPGSLLAASPVRPTKGSPLLSAAAASPGSSKKRGRDTDEKKDGGSPLKSAKASISDSPAASKKSTAVERTPEKVRQSEKALQKKAPDSPFLAKDKPLVAQLIPAFIGVSMQKKAELIVRIQEMLIGHLSKENRNSALFHREALAVIEESDWIGDVLSKLQKERRSLPPEIRNELREKHGPELIIWDLAHITEVDESGGGHFFPPGHPMRSSLKCIAVNKDTGVSYVEVPCAGKKGKKGSKTSSCFPDAIATEDHLVALLNASCELTHRQNRSLRSYRGLDMCVYLKDGIIGRSAFPFIHKITPNKDTVVEIAGKKFGHDELLKMALMAVETYDPLSPSVNPIQYITGEKAGDRELVIDISLLTNTGIRQGVMVCFHESLFKSVKNIALKIERA